MKNVYALPVFLLILIPALLQAQAGPDRKWYVRAGGGYGFTCAGQLTFLGGRIISATYELPSGSPGGGGHWSPSISAKRASFGAGAVVALAGGRMLSRNLGAELGVQSTVVPAVYRYTQSSGGAPEVEITSSARTLVSAIPALLATSNGAGLRVYGRAGVILPITDEVRIRYVTPGALNSETVYEHSLRHRFSVGFHSAAGMSYPLSGRLRISAEVAGSFRNAYAKRIEMTRYTVGGADRLETLSTSERVVEYDFEISGTFRGSDAPQQALTSASPFSSLGLSLGLWLQL